MIYYGPLRLLLEELKFGLAAEGGAMKRWWRIRRSLA